MASKVHEDTMTYLNQGLCFFFYNFDQLTRWSAINGQHESANASQADGQQKHLLERSGLTG